MAITKLTIYNRALSFIGARRLATITDAVEEQRIISEVYDDCRDSALSEHSWSFAQKRVELTNMTTPSTDSDAWVTGTAYVAGDMVLSSSTNYACIVAHTSGVFATDLAAGNWIATETPVMTEDGITQVYYKPADLIETVLFSDADAIIKIEGQRILSDTTALKLVYTYQNDTPSEYSAKFREALAVKIASEICFSITESTSKAEALLEQYVKITLPNAIFNDSTQSTPISVRQDEWENARISGSGIAGQTTDETWHPNA